MAQTMFLIFFRKNWEYVLQKQPYLNRKCSIGCTSVSFEFLENVLQKLPIHPMVHKNILIV